MSGETYYKLKIAAFLRIAAYTILSLFLLGSLPQSTYAQTKVQQEKETTVPTKSRWAFRTNAVDWLLTIPNLGVEYDLSNSIYNKLTLNLGVRWNGHTSHNIVPTTVFDLWEVRPEVRRYWRTEPRAQSGPKPSWKEQLFSKSRNNPRFWRAYYIGVYTSVNEYSFKFGKQGIQGNSYGLGLSGGYSIPLYSYKNHFIDVEFGGSLGLSYTKYDVYENDHENNCYVPIAGKSKDYHLTPFPVVSNINVSFIYRFTSIKDKYKQIDHAKIQARQLKQITRKQFKDSIRTSRQLSDSLKHMRVRMEKDSIKLQKQKDATDAPAKKSSKREKSKERKQAKEAKKQEATRKENDETK